MLTNNILSYDNNPLANEVTFLYLFIIHQHNYKYQLICIKLIFVHLSPNQEFVNPTIRSDMP